MQGCASLAAAGGNLPQVSVASKVDRPGVTTKKQVADCSLRIRGSCGRLGAAIQIRDIYIADAGSIPDKSDLAPVRRPGRTGGMLDVDQLLDCDGACCVRLLRAIIDSQTETYNDEKSCNDKFEFEHCVLRV